MAGVRAALYGFILSIGAGLALPTSAEERLVRWDGSDRRAIVQRSDAQSPAPAILVLHGGGGSAEQIQKAAGFSLIQRGWVEIYPQGLAKSWNDGRRALSGGSLRDTDDLGFLQALVQVLSNEGAIDPKRVYVAGISNGGAMAQRLVCQAPGMLAGAAVVVMAYPVGLECPDRSPVPMQFHFGVDDPIVPFHGGAITIGRRDRGGVMPAQDTIDFYARRNACGAGREYPVPDRARDGTNAVRLTFDGCAAPVEAIVIRGGGHTWSGRPRRPLFERILGKTSQDFSATKEIETFFLEADRNR